MAASNILTINGGSSSIKFALFEAEPKLKRIFSGSIDGIGRPEAQLMVKGDDPADNFTRAAPAADHVAAVGVLMDWITERVGLGQLAAVGHRVVHGGPKFSQPQRLTPELVAELHRLEPFDSQHLPEEI